MRRVLAGLLVATLVGWVGASHPSDDLPSAPTVQQPRPFGYTVGDLVTQRVPLPDDFVPPTLPDATRASVWLERRLPRVERGADGRRWLVVDYQLVNAPRALASVTVPAWQLAGPAGMPALQIPAAPVSVGPLTAPPAAGQALPLRPDRPAPAIATADIERQLWSWASALAATLAAWLAYAAWNAWRASSTLPFALAWRKLRRQHATPPEAHLALHQAFDRTAGRVVHAGTLAALFERAPHLQALRPQIERFYAQSAALFFAGALPADAVEPQALCRQLRRLERRHAP